MFGILIGSSSDWGSVARQPDCGERARGNDHEVVC